METIIKYQKDVERLLGSIESVDIGEMTIRKLLEKQDIVDAILKEMESDELEDTVLFEELVKHGDQLVRAEHAKDRLEEMKSEIIVKFRKKFQHLFSEQTFVNVLNKYLSLDQRLAVMERVEASFIFDLVLNRVLDKMPVSPKILELDADREYRLDEIEEIDEAEAFRAQKEAFNYILNEEEKVTNSSNDYMFNRAKGVKKARFQGQDVFQIISLTIGRGYTPMFNKGDQFEMEGSVYTVLAIDITNRFATRNVLMGRIDADARLQLRVKIPIHYQRYTCKKED